jgi:hypothetical protein
MKFGALISPACERLEIVGGVKRADKPEVHDIEFLVIADVRRPRPEFGQKVIHKTMLDKVLFELCEMGLLKRVMGGDKLQKYEIVEARKTEVNPFCLEIYIVRPETWGIQNVIRTGPAEFSHCFVTNRGSVCYDKESGHHYYGLLPDDCQYIRGETRIERNGLPLDLPEEADALVVIGKGWIEPRDRRRYAVRKG